MVFRQGSYMGMVIDVNDTWVYYRGYVGKDTVGLPVHYYGRWFIRPQYVTIVCPD